jgi:hypothetical protein
MLKKMKNVKDTDKIIGEVQDLREQKESERTALFDYIIDKRSAENYWRYIISKGYLRSADEWTRDISTLNVFLNFKELIDILNKETEKNNNDGTFRYHMWRTTEMPAMYYNIFNGISRDEKLEFLCSSYIYEFGGEKRDSLLKMILGETEDEEIEDTITYMLSLDDTSDGDNEGILDNEEI